MPVPHWSLRHVHELRANSSAFLSFWIPSSRTDTKWYSLPLSVIPDPSNVSVLKTTMSFFISHQMMTTHLRFSLLLAFFCLISVAVSAFALSNDLLGLAPQGMLLTHVGFLLFLSFLFLFFFPCFCYEIDWNLYWVSVFLIDQMWGIMNMRWSNARMGLGNSRKNSWMMTSVIAQMERMSQVCSFGALGFGYDEMGMHFVYFQFFHVFGWWFWLMGSFSFFWICYGLRFSFDYWTLKVKPLLCFVLLLFPISVLCL